MPTTSYSGWLTSNLGHHHVQNLWCLLLIALVLILSGVGLRDPWPADEPRFAQIAMEMVQSGQWFFPYRGGELYPDKPPIFMWAIAVFYWLSGSIKLAFLLPSALSGIATVYLVYSLGRKLWSAQIGFYAALLLLFSLQFTLQAKTAQIDAMVCLWITLGCYGLLRFLLIDGLWRWYYFAWFFMGIGVITKGVGFLPLLMLLPYALLRITKWQNAKTSYPHITGSWRWLLGPLVMLVAIGLWFVPMLLLVEHSNNPLYEVYRDNILFKQTVKRYADSWHHIKPAWYYLVSVIPLFWLPISLLLPWLAVRWQRACQELDYRIMLPLVWIVLVLVFFSASPGKRGVYVLPALPMLALISAPYLRDILSKVWPPRLLWSLVLLLSMVLLVAGIAGWFELAALQKLAIKYQLEPWAFFTTVGVGGLVCAAIFNHRSQRNWLSWPSFISLLWLLYSTWGYSLLGAVKTPKGIFSQMSQFVPADAELALVKFSEQFILFSPYAVTHFGYHTDEQQQLRAAWQWQSNHPQRYVLLDKLLISQCYDAAKGVDLGYVHGEDWVLLGPDSRLAECQYPEQPLIEYHYQPAR